MYTCLILGIPGDRPVVVNQDGLSCSQSVRIRRRKKKGLRLNDVPMMQRILMHAVPLFVGEHTELFSFGNILWEKNRYADKNFILSQCVFLNY